MSFSLDYLEVDYNDVRWIIKGMIILLISIIGDSYYMYIKIE